MAEKAPAPPRRVFHRAMSLHSPKMFESFCVLCGQFVAASTKEELVELVESLHLCAEPIAPLSRKPPKAAR